MIDYTQLSKAVSHALRHEPWLYELELDEQGWVKIDELLEALQHRRPAWKRLSRNDLTKMVGSSGKQRHEIAGDQIRALYGHSLPGRLLREKAPPPERLYHGTARSVEKLVMSNGLLPMGRQYVHLSTNIEMAVQVGRRKDPDPVIIKVAAKEAWDHGVSFYIGNEAVWLADEIPPKYIAIA